MRIIARLAIAAAAAASAPTVAADPSTPSIASFVHTRTPPAQARRGTGFPVARDVVAWRPDAPGWDEAIYLRKDDGVDKVFLRKDAAPALRARLSRSLLAEMRRYGPVRNEGGIDVVRPSTGAIRFISLHRAESGVSVGMAIARS